MFLPLVCTGPPAGGTTGLFSWDLDNNDQGKELSPPVIALALCGLLERGGKMETSDHLK